MKTRKCRMTPQQREMHNKAVSIRNMTDEQLMEYLDCIKHNAEEIGYERGHAEKKYDCLISFLRDLDTIKGIGVVTVTKLRRHAVDAGYVSREEVME